MRVVVMLQLLHMYPYPFPYLPSPPCVFPGIGIGIDVTRFGSEMLPYGAGGPGRHARGWEGVSYSTTGGRGELHLRGSRKEVVWGFDNKIPFLVFRSWQMGHVLCGVHDIQAGIYLPYRGAREPRERNKAWRQVDGCRSLGLVCFGSGFWLKP